MVVYTGITILLLSYEMLIRLDKHICADFLAQGVSDVFVQIVSAGCAGSKISLAPITEENAAQKGLVSTERDKGMRVWCQPEFAEKLDGAQIARAKGKLYLVGKAVQARCGCGTSFSFEKKTVSQDLAKIHRLRNALRASAEMNALGSLIFENLKAK